MAKIVLQDNPSLTKERIIDLFRAEFPQYEVITDTILIGVDFVLKKSAFTGVSFKYVYKPEKGKVFIRFGAFSPSPAVRILLYGLLTLLILLPSWMKITNEVKEFIRSNPEFGAVNP